MEQGVIHSNLLKKLKNLLMQKLILTKHLFVNFNAFYTAFSFSLG